MEHQRWFTSWGPEEAAASGCSGWRCPPFIPGAPGVEGCRASHTDLWQLTALPAAPPCHTRPCCRLLCPGVGVKGAAPPVQPAGTSADLAGGGAGPAARHPQLLLRWRRSVAGQGMPSRRPGDRQGVQLQVAAASLVNPSFNQGVHLLLVPGLPSCQACPHVLRPLGRPSAPTLCVLPSAGLVAALGPTVLLGSASGLIISNAWAVASDRAVKAGKRCLRAWPSCAAGRV